MVKLQTLSFNGERIGGNINVHQFYIVIFSVLQETEFGNPQFSF